MASRPGSYSFRLSGFSVIIRTSGGTVFEPTPLHPPSAVYEIWSGEFDGAYEEGGMFLPTMHPHIIGHRSRIRMLERLIQHMRSRSGVWFATHEQVARHAKDQG